MRNYIFKDHAENKKKTILRWYGTPCNIYKEERILNYDYNHGLKKLEIKSFFLQKASQKLYQRDEK